MRRAEARIGIVIGTQPFRRMHEYGMARLLLMACRHVSQLPSDALFGSQSYRACAKNLRLVATPEVITDINRIFSIFDDDGLNLSFHQIGPQAHCCT